MWMTRQQHLEEAERLLQMVAALTEELDLSQPAMLAKLQAVEWQAEHHLKLAAAMLAKEPKPDWGDGGW